MRNKNLNDAARKQLEQIVKARQQLIATAKGIETVGRQSADLVQHQERLRQNIGSLNQVNGQQQQVQAYARQLGEDDTQLAALRDRSTELDKKHAAIEGEIKSAIANTEF